MTGKKAEKANATEAGEVTVSLIKTETESAMSGKGTSDLKDATGEEEMKTNNNLSISKFIGLALMFVLLNSSALSQFSLSTGLNMSYNDNINSNYEFLSDEVSRNSFLKQLMTFLPKIKTCNCIMKALSIISEEM